MHFSMYIDNNEMMSLKRFIVVKQVKECKQKYRALDKLEFSYRIYIIFSIFLNEMYIVNPH